MQIKKDIKILTLYILYFLFLWGGQLSSYWLSLEDSLINTYFVLLYIFFISRAVTWFLILRKMDLIKAYTISSINYLFIPLLSYVVLGEHIEPKHIIGGLFIITGIIVYRFGEGVKKG